MLSTDIPESLRRRQVRGAKMQTTMAGKNRPPSRPKRSTLGDALVALDTVSRKRGTAGVEALKKGAAAFSKDPFKSGSISQAVDKAYTSSLKAERDKLKKKREEILVTRGQEAYDRRYKPSKITRKK